LGPLGRALQRLDLSSEQQDRIRGMVEAARPQLQALRGQLRDGRQTFREAHPPTDFDEAAIRAHVAAQSGVMADLAVLGAKLRADVLAVLTPEQLEQLEGMRAKRQEWRKMRREFWDDGS
jgi:Spy/CpxP family protein refolding chaperone